MGKFKFGDKAWKVDPDGRQDRRSGPVTTYKMSEGGLEKYKDLRPPKGKKTVIGGWDVAHRKKKMREREENDHMKTGMVESIKTRVEKGESVEAVIEDLVQKGHNRSVVCRCASKAGVYERQTPKTKKAIDKPIKDSVVPTDKYQRHMEICEKLNKLYKDKNTAYGDAFSSTFQELGIISAVTRMSDKWNRIKALALGAENNITDELMTDTLEDLANYSIMTLIEIENSK